MSLPSVVSRTEWLEARRQLLAAEKKQTRERDALNADRRRLPMVRIDKEYVFEGPDGKAAGIEVKASASPSSGDARHLRWLKDKLGDKMTTGVVLHLGDTAGSLGNGIYALPVASLWGQRPLPAGQ